MSQKKDIASRLNQVFLIQIVFISLATILGVFGAAKVVEDILIKEALQGEARFFWDHYNKDNNFPLPNTMNLTGYMVTNDDYTVVPKSLEGLKDDYQRVHIGDNYPIVYRTFQDDKKLYLIFEESQVSKLAVYFGIAPLVFVLLAIYLPAFVSYVLSKRAISPILQLVKKLQSVGISQRQLENLNFDDITTTGNAEAASLIEAFENFSHRISDFISRERNFSRYASHELRTPLTIIKGSLALLAKKDLDEGARKQVDRMQPVILEMQELIESLLLLSREQEVVYSEHPVIVNDLVKYTAEQTMGIFEEKNLTLEWAPEHLVEARLPEQLLAIVITNLVRNACLYSHDGGEIKIVIVESEIRIQDFGRGMNQEQLEKIFEPFYRVEDTCRTGGKDRKGFGLGLSIVEWICNQCQWELSYESALGQGTVVTLKINEAVVLN
ncbi:sensor histidine kinase [Marinicella sp. W31]|uniref:sensor histidine kinase n=1 Tax=Marinicella sp. W31 TaxID=3023713 RepID=UPI003757E021